MSDTVTDCGPGDYVKLFDGQWHEIESNTAFGARPLPRNWTIVTKDGHSVNMWQVKAYRKSRGEKTSQRPIKLPYEEYQRLLEIEGAARQLQLVEGIAGHQFEARKRLKEALAVKKVEL